MKYKTEKYFVVTIFFLAIQNLQNRHHCNSFFLGPQGFIYFSKAKQEWWWR